MRPRRDPLGLAAIFMAMLLTKPLSAASPVLTPFVDALPIPRCHSRR